MVVVNQVEVLLKNKLFSYGYAVEQIVRRVIYFGGLARFGQRNAKKCQDCGMSGSKSTKNASLCFFRVCEKTQTVCVCVLTCLAFRSQKGKLKHKRKHKLPKKQEKCVFWGQPIETQSFLAVHMGVCHASVASLTARCHVDRQHDYKYDFTTQALW